MSAREQLDTFERGERRHRNKVIVIVAVCALIPIGFVLMPLLGTWEHRNVTGMVSAVTLAEGYGSQDYLVEIKLASGQVVLLTEPRRPEITVGDAATVRVSTNSFTGTSKYQRLRKL